MGILYLTTIALLVGAGLVWLVTSRHKARHPILVAIGRLSSVVVVLAVLTWPFFVGRWIFDAECKYLAGYRIDRPVDARSEGLYDRRLLQQRSLYGVSENYFVVDVQDLTDGRVAFVETDVGTIGFGNGHAMGQWYDRFFLADVGSEPCVSPLNKFAALAKTSLPAGKCLAIQRGVTSRKSRFEMSTSGYHHTDSHATTKIIDKKDGRTAAIFRSYNHFNPLNFVSGRDGVCPRYADRTFSLHKTLASMTFVDRDGRTKDLTQLEAEDK